MARTGAEVGLDIDLGLSARLGDLSDQVTELRNGLHVPSATPVELTGSWDRTTTVTVDGVSCAYFALQQQCPVGYTWDLRRLGVGAGLSPITASQVGVWYVFASQADRDFSYMSWVDAATIATPQSAFYSPGEFPVYGGERVYFLVTGFAVNTELSATGTAIQRKGQDIRAIAAVG